MKNLKVALHSKSVRKGEGYYIRVKDSASVYTVWKDTKSVTVLSTAYPGHSENKVKGRVKTASGATQVQPVPIPLSIEKYNANTGGVDMSNQLISYYRVLRRTVRYWKTMFYHILEIICTNSSIIFNWLRMVHGKKQMSENNFRDHLVLHIVSKYGCSMPPLQSFSISHGSCFSTQRRRCSLCLCKQT